MLSDDTSSDSETGRFKCRSKPEKEQESKHKDENRSLGRNRNSESSRFRRDFDRRRDDRNNFSKDSRDRDRYRHSRGSPRRRLSREKSSDRKRSHERKYSRERSTHSTPQDKHKHERESKVNSKPRDQRSNSKDKHRHSRSRSNRRDLKDDRRHSDKVARHERESISLSPNNRGKRSEVFKPPPSTSKKRKSESPIIVEEHSDSDDLEKVQPGSYYSMIPAVVTEKSEESSEIDSSDDEKLRAKLLNLEKKLHKTKKKKHRKKHKKKHSKSKERDPDPPSVEVTSTTDIEDKSKIDLTKPTDPVAEVTSTQKNIQKESSEEGEILSDDDSQKEIDIDPNDLRHKLKRSKHGSSSQEKDVCGPVLPPHWRGQHARSVSPSVEGPALPPHLQRRPGNIGPVIADDMRKVLAQNDRQVIKYELSDEEDIGPLPVGAEDKWSDAHKRLEVRALNMKIRQLDGHTLQSHQVKSREQWMLELPEGKAKYIGLEARSFRAKEGPDMSDRSSWTDTPEEKARKAAGIVKEEDADVVLKREAKARHITNRDLEQEEAVRKHKKKHKREESLLDIHQKKIKKKKKKDDKGEEKKERRPFSRDVDLQVNRFDEAQKKSIIKKAQDLDGRFSKGEAKYL